MNEYDEQDAFDDWKAEQARPKDPKIRPGICWTCDTRVNSVKLERDDGSLAWHCPYCLTQIGMQPIITNHGLF